MPRFLFDATIATTGEDEQEARLWAEKLAENAEALNMGDVVVSADSAELLEEG